MNNVTVVFHKSLMKYTENVREVKMTPDVIYYLFINCLNLYPGLERFCKKAAFSKLEDIAIIKNNKCLSSEEFLFPAKEGDTFYLVPIFKGSGAEIAVGFAIGFTMSFASSMIQGASFGQALLRGLIGGAAGAVGAYGFGQFATPVMDAVGANFAAMAPTIGSYAAAGLASAVGSIVQNTLVPIKPKYKTADSADAGDRPNNDAFDAQVNTISSNQAIPLNYGMIRVAGQIISADVNSVNHSKEQVISVVDYV